MKIKWYKIVVWILVGIVALFFILATWYKFEYSMDTVEPYAIYSSSFKDKLLIASQGSDFKNAVVKGVVTYYENIPLFIRVIDVSGLPQVNPADYDAVLILHTWEYDRPPKTVTQFITENMEYSEMFVVLSTSGEGDNTIQGVDGFAGESIMVDVPGYIDQVVKKIDTIMNYHNTIMKYHK